MSDLSVAIQRAKEGSPYEGVRAAELEDVSSLDDDTVSKIQTILDAMYWPQLIGFGYGESDRLVAPFVVGVSREGNPLMRGYQMEGISRSGKGPGWRVFQVKNMDTVQIQGDYFDATDFQFVEYYPWLYKVVRML